MAISLPPTGEASEDRYQPLAEINVTPMVDVMLVLLIIFMVTAPLLTVGIPVNLPQTKAEPLSNPDEPLVVTVNAKGEIYLQETSIGDEALVPRLQAITANKPDTKIFVRGDKAIDYGRVMQVMGMIKSASEVGSRSEVGQLSICGIDRRAQRVRGRANPASRAAAAAALAATDAAGGNRAGGDPAAADPGTVCRS